MDLNKIGRIYKRHIEKTVGKSPSKTEMDKISKEMNIVNKQLKKKNKTSKEIKKLYNSKLSKYWKKIVSYENSLNEIKLILKNLKIEKDSKITSIGSGICVFESFLSKNINTKGETICIDISEEMSKIARKIVNKEKIRNIKIINASANKIPLKENTQDIMIARRTGLSPTNSWPEILNEVHRILRKNNKSIFVYTVSKKFSGNTSRIKNQLKRAGLKYLKEKTFKEKDGSTILAVFAKNEKVWPVPSSKKIIPNPQSLRGYGGRRRGNRLHAGTDIFAKYSSKVVAIESGIVVNTFLFTYPLLDKYNKYEKTWAVVIKHEDGNYALYGEMQKPKVKKNQKVKAGDIIGKVGRIFANKKTHTMLHFEYHSKEPKKTTKWYKNKKPSSLLSSYKYLKEIIE